MEESLHLRPLVGNISSRLDQFKVFREFPSVEIGTMCNVNNFSDVFWILSVEVQF